MGGSSLELIDFNLDNSIASSWQDSFVIPGGTPGYSNSLINESGVFDCFGICDGNAVVDECGICGGNGIAEDF